MPWPANSDEFFNKHLAVYPMTNPKTPAPALDKEREKLARFFEDHAAHLRKMESIGALGETKLTPAMERAATFLRQPAPAVLPVPVAERPWKREGWCDAEGRCWWSHGPTPTARWSLLPMDGMDDARGWLLPHWAIPIPQPPLGVEVQP